MSHSGRTPRGFRGAVSVSLPGPSFSRQPMTRGESGEEGRRDGGRTRAVLATESDHCCSNERGEAKAGTELGLGSSLSLSD